MSFRFTAARVISGVSTWGLRRVFRRPAGNFPGKLALYVDPQLIADLASKAHSGSVVVCGTNGKTTVTNLLADSLEASGFSTICNRSGANLRSGIATTLLQSDEADWGVFECDEMWAAKVLPQLKPTYLLLLNLFRDQLDRVGEIRVVQDSIVSALASSPGTILIYNADDPLCAAIAAECSNASVAFGVSGSIGLEQNAVADAQMCQQCFGMLEYRYRQYGQLGEYHCPQCGFARPALDYAAVGTTLDAAGLSFGVEGPRDLQAQVEAPYSGAYMVYNLLAVYVAADLVGGTLEGFKQALDAFDPQNGRLQQLVVGGRSVLMNLAKNPTGFNQNIALIKQDNAPKVIAFYVNDKEGDGRDVSWLWDIDFEELAEGEGSVVFAGGIRKNDLQVRLKYAGITADLVENAGDVFSKTAALSPDHHYYFIANYTALPSIREELVGLAAGNSGADPEKRGA